jgi:hypothetical protein
VSWLSRRSGAGGQVRCPRCDVGYDPSLVDGACPVCGQDAPGRASPRRAGVDNALLLVGTATIANLLLLSVLAVLLLR